MKFKKEKLVLGFIPPIKYIKKSNLVKRAFQPNNEATPKKIKINCIPKFPLGASDVNFSIYILLLLNKMKIKIKLYIIFNLK